jgi:hypothetical protein
MSVMSSQLDGLMDRLVVERAIDTITVRQIEAVLRKYDASVQTATVDNLIARPSSVKIMPAEVEATAKRIVMAKTADRQVCGLCEGTGMTEDAERAWAPCRQCRPEDRRDWTTTVRAHERITPELSDADREARTEAMRRVKAALLAKVGR